MTPPTRRKLTTVTPADPGDAAETLVVEEPSGSEPVTEPEPRAPEADEPAPDHDDAGQARRAAIIPAPLGPGQIGQTLRDFGVETGYRLAFHGVRTPVYACGSAWYATRGAARLAGRWGRWVTCPEMSVLVSQAVARGEAGHSHAMQASAHGEKLRTKRWQVSGACALGAVPPALVTALAAPWEVQAAAAAAAFAGLVHQGRPKGRPILPAAILPPAYQPPTAELIREALASIGIPAIGAFIKSKGDLDWVSDVHRDGDGWAVELDLPKGVTAGHIIKRRKELSSALRRPLSAVWPEGVSGEHEGRLFLWIGRHDWGKKKLVPYPLLKSGTADFFDLVPYGTMPRGNAITVPLFQTNWLFGGAMGAGKTAALRTLLAAAALDPVVDLWTHEFSGKGDLEPFAQVSHRYVSGLDDEAVAYAAESVRLLRKDLESRQKIWKQIPRDQRPHGHLTRDIALADRRLRPIVATFDECHNMFQHPQYGKQIQTDLEWVMRIGRAYGIVVLLGTQRPGADSIPVIITAVTVARCCLKVGDHVTNDMILGSGSYSRGYDATVFRLPFTDAGCCWLKGIGDTIAPKIYYLNDPATQKVTTRARAVRERAGVLSGYALGEDEDGQERDLLADVESVFVPGERGLHRETIAARLAARYGAYSSVTADAVASQLRALTGDDSIVRDTREAGGLNRKGVRLDELRAAREAAASPCLATDDTAADDTELLAAAAELVITPQFASEQMLGRKLRVNSARAAELMGRLEDHRVVGPADEDGRRDVLVGPADLDGAIARIRKAARGAA